MLPETLPDCHPFARCACCGFWQPACRPDNISALHVWKPLPGHAAGTCATCSAPWANEQGPQHLRWNRQCSRHPGNGLWEPHCERLGADDNSFLMLEEPADVAVVPRGHRGRLVFGQNIYHVQNLLVRFFRPAEAGVSALPRRGGPSLS